MQLGMMQIIQDGRSNRPGRHMPFQQVVKAGEQLMPCELDSTRSNAAAAAESSMQDSRTSLGHARICIQQC